uniref:Uncharacterized protein n=1 Tax=Anguilla anguilla TaxID=7936 RepID=A0A0E9W5R1_ANGAN
MDTYYVAGRAVTSLIAIFSLPVLPTGPS